jgi:hypothetical protein
MTIYILQLFNINEVQPEDLEDDQPGNGTILKDTPTDSYSIVPCSGLVQKADKQLNLVRQWHSTLGRPSDLSDTEYETFLHYCIKFFVSDDWLWRKDHKGEHKLVVPLARRLFIMASAHDDMGHHGFYATNALITLKYWWPFMGNDITWFVKTCQICQTQKTRNLLIPPMVSTPTPLFAKIYINTMHMPPSRGFKYIIQGWCSITEFNLLHNENM